MNTDENGSLSMRAEEELQRQKMITASLETEIEEVDAMISFSRRQLARDRDESSARFELAEAKQALVEAKEMAAWSMRRKDTPELPDIYGPDSDAEAEFWANANARAVRMVGGKSAETDSDDQYTEEQSDHGRSEFAARRAGELEEKNDRNPDDGGVVEPLMPGLDINMSGGQRIQDELNRLMEVAAKFSQLQAGNPAFAEFSAASGGPNLERELDALVASVQNELLIARNLDGTMSHALNSVGSVLQEASPKISEVGTPAEPDSPSITAKYAMPIGDYDRYDVESESETSSYTSETYDARGNSTSAFAVHPSKLEEGEVISHKDATDEEDAAEEWYPTIGDTVELYNTGEASLDGRFGVCGDPVDEERLLVYLLDGRQVAAWPENLKAYKNVSPDDVLRQAAIVQSE